MKTLISTLSTLLLLYLSPVSGQEKVNEFVASKGSWGEAENWSMGRVPESGDHVLIPESADVILDKTREYSSLYLICEGQLYLQESALVLNEESRIDIAESGCIMSSHGSEEERITIGKQIKFNGPKDGRVCGFATAHNKTGTSPDGFSKEKERPSNIFSGKNNSWDNKDSWSLKRIPEDGDEVIISEKSSALLQETKQLENISLRISGKLTLEKSMLRLGKWSSMIIEKSGMLESLEKNDEESIVIGEDLKFSGEQDRMISGFAVADQSTGISPNGFSYDATLPIVVGRFSARIIKEDILIEWKLSGEGKPTRFDLQESSEGIEWRALSTLYSSVTPVIDQDYSYTSANHRAGKIYLRLRLVDIDLLATYSKVIILNKAESLSAVVSRSGPHELSLTLQGIPDKNVTARIISPEGNLLFSGPVHGGKNILQCRVFGQLSRQLYILQVSENKKSLFSRSFLIY